MATSEILTAKKVLEKALSDLRARFAVATAEYNAAHQARAEVVNRPLDRAALEKVLTGVFEGIREKWSVRMNEQIDIFRRTPDREFQAAHIKSLSDACSNWEWFLANGLGAILASSMLGGIRSYLETLPEPPDALSDDDRAKALADADRRVESASRELTAIQLEADELGVSLS